MEDVFNREVTAKFTVGKIVSKYLIMEIISYCLYADEGADLLFGTNKSMRQLVQENYRVLYKIFKRRKVISIDDSFWKLASPRVISKNIIFNVKTMEDLMIIRDFKVRNRKLKIEGINIPNLLLLDL